MSTSSGKGRSRAISAALSVLVAALFAAPARAEPHRIVSLNPCLDDILVQVADRAQIAALSHYSRDPASSAIAPLARTYPFTWGSGEEVAAIRPDLVLTSSMGGMALLSRLGVVSANFTVPNSVRESEAQVARIARLVGHPERGVVLNARINAALAAAAPSPGAPRLSALLYQSYGFASGPHTLTDELMTRAGFDNYARHYGMKRSGDVPLEQVIADPPHVLLIGELAYGEPGWADRVLSNPALAAIGDRMKRERFPAQLHFCGGPVIIPAVQALVRARRDATGEGGR